ARYRNRLYAVQHLVERQAVERQSVGTVDVIGFAAEGDRAVVQIFPLRGGKMIDRHSFHLENVGGQDVTTILESFSLEYYGRAPRRGDRGAPGGAQPGVFAAADRVLRHLDGDGPGQRRLDGRLRGRPAEEGALSQVRDPRTGRTRRLRGDGGDDPEALRADGA